MRKEVIAIIRLAPGEVGFYDELTGIHLTRARPERPIFSGMNTKNLRKGVRYGRLQLVSGSLAPKTKTKEPAAAPKKKAAGKKEQVKAKKQEAVDKAIFEQGSGEITISPKLTEEEIQKADTGKKGGAKKQSGKKKQDS